MLTQYTPTQSGFSSLPASLMSTAAQQMAAPGTRADKLLARWDAEDAKAYQRERDKKADERAAMQDARANLLEGRQAEQFATDKATREANAAASNILTAQGSNVVSENQMKYGRDLKLLDGVVTPSNKYADAYDKLLTQKGMTQEKAGAIMQSMMDKDVAAYNASPVLQKHHMGTVSVGMGPSEQTVQTIDPTTGRVVDKILSVAPDMKEANLRKDNLLQGLDRQIEADEARKQQWDMMKENQKFTAGQNAIARAHATKLASLKTDKFEPVDYTVKDPKTGKARLVTVRSQSQLLDLLQSTEGTIKNKNGEYINPNISMGKPVDDDFSTSGGKLGKPVGTNLTEDIGARDTPRILGVANVLYKAGVPASQAESLAEMAKERSWYGGVGVNFNKILTPAWEELKKVDPTITKKETAILLNQAF